MVCLQGWPFKGLEGLGLNLSLLTYNITDMPKEHCCSVLFISKTHAKNISVLPKKTIVQIQESHKIGPNLKVTSEILLWSLWTKMGKDVDFLATIDIPVSRVQLFFT